MKIAIVVPGRFYAFDLARSLIELGDEVTIFTNYPGWAMRRFGILPKNTRSFVLHGIAARLTWWMHQNLKLPFPESVLNQMFGRWAILKLKKERWDVVHCFSGLAEEILREIGDYASAVLLVRGSSHIRTQSVILEEEMRRVSVPLGRPSAWIIAREEREYALANRILVLSRFAYQSFLAEGVPREKLRLFPLGTPTSTFRPSHAVIQERCRRLRSGEPLRVLFVGALSFRKGLFDLSEIIRRLAPEGRYQFRCVGPMGETKTKKIMDGLVRSSSAVEIFPSQPEAQLPSCYAWGDLFLFPTLEDGYAVVLAQAHAGGLPVLTTINCSGPDWVREGVDGWLFAIRSPGAFVERLRWCDSHREELAHLIENLAQNPPDRDWRKAAIHFQSICLEALEPTLEQPVGARTHWS